MKAILDHLRVAISEDALHVGGPFQLASGKTSDWYVDLSILTYRRWERRMMGRALWKLLKPHGIDAIAGPMSGACPLLFAVQEEADNESYRLRVLRVRKETKTYGAKDRVVGEPRRGDRVALLEDVVTTGKTSSSACEALLRHHQEVVVAACVVNREGTGGIMAGPKRIKLLSLFTGKNLDQWKPE